MSGRMPSPQIFMAVGLSIFVFVSFLLYASVDTGSRVRQDVYSNSQSESLTALRRKIDELERQLKKNGEFINKFDKKIDEELANRKDGPVEPPPVRPPPNQHLNAEDLADEPPAADAHDEAHLSAVLRRPTAPAATQQCAARAPVGDVQMLDAYERIPFDNPDGGVWKQGFELSYDKQKIRQEKRLEVVVVPHSHCDPGWLMTFEQYFKAQTKNILDGMLKHLPKKKDMSFIYAEMSFFELWWSGLIEEERETARKLLQSGQLEIVTGGWVMTDEANAHSFAIVMELIEGHEFLANHLNYRPTSHWSIDPFGLSSTLPYLVRSANLTQMAVQRVHYSVKKFLAQSKQLEFAWRQMFAGAQHRTDMRTHMFPFFSYDIPHTCGPDPAVCCQFDFRRLTSFGCPWGKRPQRITEKNVAARAEVLADQYRKKAQLYQMNTVLIPLGDDFRYDVEAEWEDQYSNYKQLFEYMNAKTELNIHARFGTLKDYFDILNERLVEEQKQLPVLSGDFFSYADRDDHYWTGYFTSRPFYKHMDRTLQAALRSADILFSVVGWLAGSDSHPLVDHFDDLITARRSLSLFQHHDGVTGTGRDFVVIDYAEKMVKALNDSQRLIAAAVAHLLHFPEAKGVPHLRSIEEHSIDQLPKQLVVEDGSTIVVYNSMAQKRDEVVCVRVASGKSRVRAAKSAKELPQQIQPAVEVAENRFAVDRDIAELCWRAEVPPLGVQRYEVFEAADDSHRSKITVSREADSRLFDSAEILKPEDEPTIANTEVVVSFDSASGYLKAVHYAAEAKVDLTMDFLHYGARGHNKSRDPGGDNLSGAYLFLPDGPAQPIPKDTNAFVLVKGAVRQTLYLKGPDTASVQQQIHLDVNANAPEVRTVVDVRPTSNFELVMRFSAPAFDTADEQLYTDLNGIQMIRRKRFDKLPLQAHFYPMPSAAFVESTGRRFSLLGRQALGVGSLRAGQLEVVLDRRLMQDDGRGLAGGVTDNRRTESRFRILVEPVEQPADADRNRVGFLSAAAAQHSHSLHYPLQLLSGQLDSATSAEVPTVWSPLRRPFPCDVHLFALRTNNHPTEYGPTGNRRTQPRRSASLILHRFGVDCMGPKSKAAECEETNGQVIFGDYFEHAAKSYVPTSLTGMYADAQPHGALTLEPMDLKAVKLEF